MSRGSDHRLPFWRTWLTGSILAVLVSIGLLFADSQGRSSGESGAPTAAPPDAPLSLFLIGDAGAPTDSGDEPVLLALERDAARNSAASFIVFLGDNIYPKGMPLPADPERREAERRLARQVEVFRRAGVAGIFIPGNHDWAYHGADGWDAIRRQEDFILRAGIPGVRLEPPGGCPGPVVLDFGDRLRLIAIDTQWFLHGSVKPTGPQCKDAAVRDSVLDRLRTALEGGGSRPVVVVGHHPTETYGNHGGYFTWEDHIFPLRHAASWLWLPLPVIGSAYPIARGAGVSDQDVSGSGYQRLIRDLDSVFAFRPPLAYASGHEHTLQVIKGARPYYMLVSGNGMEGHENPLGESPSMLYGSIEPGFMRLDVFADGSARLAVVQAGDTSGTPREVFARWLLGGP